MKMSNQQSNSTANKSHMEPTTSSHGPGFRSVAIQQQAMPPTLERFSIQRDLLEHTNKSCVGQKNRETSTSTRKNSPKQDRGVIENSSFDPDVQEEEPAPHQSGEDLRLWGYQLTMDQLERVPQDYPLERTSLVLRGVALEVVTDRMVQCLQRVQAVVPWFSAQRDDEQSASMECRVGKELKFRIQLWAAVQDQDDDAIVVELQRLRGCPVALHRIRRPLFYALLSLLSSSDDKLLAMQEFRLHRQSSWKRPLRDKLQRLQSLSTISSSHSNGSSVIHGGVERGTLPAIPMQDDGRQFPPPMRHIFHD